MPFKSKSQSRYLFAKEPDVAKEFAEKTPDMESLPEKKKKKTGSIMKKMSEDKKDEMKDKRIGVKENKVESKEY